jgi:hypothetical protein
VAEILSWIDLEGIEDKLRASSRANAEARGPRAHDRARAEIVIYDEPTTGLDPLTSDTISDLIRRLQKERRLTSIVVTHDIRCTSRRRPRRDDRRGADSGEGNARRDSRSEVPKVRAFSMDERRRDTVVGIFVVVSIAVAMVMVALLGSEQGIFRRRFQVRAVFGNVSGLGRGAGLHRGGETWGPCSRSLRLARRWQAAARATGTEEVAKRVGVVEVALTIEERFRAADPPRFRSRRSLGRSPRGQVDRDLGRRRAEAEVASGDVLQSEDRSRSPR